MKVTTPLSARQAWPLVRAKWLFTRQQRPAEDGDEIVTAFRDGQVTLRSNRRTDGFTNAVQEIGYQGIRLGDLVIHSMDGFAGAIGVSDSDGKASPVVSTFTSEHADARYFAYVLRELARSGFIMSLGKGIRERSTAFDAETFRSLVLPTPPLAAQRAIADYLDAETARIDALIEKKQRISSLSSERITASIAALLEDACDETTPLKRLVSKIGSGSTPRGGSDVYVPSGVAFLRSQNIREGRIDSSDLVHISADVDEDMAATRVQPGDVLINITGGSIGRTAVVTTEDLPANVSQHVCIVRPLSQIDPVLLQASLESRHVKEQIGLVQAGGNREGLNFEQVGNLQVRVPRVAASAIRVQIDHLIGRGTMVRKILGRQIELMREHRQTLITAAVTGELKIEGVAA